MRTYTSPEEIDAQMKEEKERKQVGGGGGGEEVGGVSVSGVSCDSWFLWQNEVESEGAGAQPDGVEDQLPGSGSEDSDDADGSQVPAPSARRAAAGGEAEVWRRRSGGGGLEVEVWRWTSSLTRTSGIPSAPLMNTCSVCRGREAARRA